MSVSRNDRPDHGDADAPAPPAAADADDARPDAAGAPEVADRPGAAEAAEAAETAGGADIADDVDRPGPESPEGDRPEPRERPERLSAADRGRLANDLDEVQRGRPERAFNVGAAFGVLVTLAAVIFVFQNRQKTQFDWLWFDFEIPLWTAFVGAVVVGVVMVLTALAVHHRRQGRIVRRRDASGRLRRALTGSRTRTA